MCHLYMESKNKINVYNKTNSLTDIENRGDIVGSWEREKGQGKIRVWD